MRQINDPFSKRPLYSSESLQQPLVSQKIYGFTALVTYLYLIRIPVTGSFSRTAVNCASGVKTPLGGIYTGALVLLALGLLMPFCAYIPKASLAAVIITAVIFRFVRSCTCLQCLCNVLVKMKAFSYRPT